MSDFETAREAMVDRQVRPSDVTDRNVISAMLDVPRERFAPRGRRAAAYADAPLNVAPGRDLLEPRVFAKLLDALILKPHEAVLVVGGATGYAAAVIAQMADAVVMVESDDDLAQRAQATLSELGAYNASVVTGPLPEGAARHGPYQAIFVDGGVEIEPETLYDQLAEGGRLVAVWMDGPVGRARLVTKAQSVVSGRTIFDASAGILPGFTKTAEFVF